MERINREPSFLKSMLFTDEATFYLHDGWQNARYWTRNNLHRYHSIRTQNSVKINVWTNIIATNIIGSFLITFG